jgi:hypothetical protein
MADQDPLDGSDSSAGHEAHAGEDGAARRGRASRWLTGSHRWQTLIGAVVAAVATVVVALLVQNPPPPPESSADDGPVVVATPVAPVDEPAPDPVAVGTPVVSVESTTQEADPTGAVLVHFVGRVTGLDDRHSVFAMVRQPDQLSGWPVSIANVNPQDGSWTATVYVPDPGPSITCGAGTIPRAQGANAAPGNSALDTLRTYGPDAPGVNLTSPFQPVSAAQP